MASLLREGMRPATDGRLRSEVAEAICRRLGRKAERLSISTEGSSVTVRGTLQSFYEKQLSLHAAKNVPGVAALIDELEVAYIWDDA